MERIAVVDYGMGNLRSVAKALELVAEGEAEVVVTDQAEVLTGADRVVFPGQGHIRDCMDSLERLGLQAVLEEAAIDPTPKEPASAAAVGFGRDVESARNSTRLPRTTELSA